MESKYLAQVGRRFAEFVGDFDGKHYERKMDKERLARQIKEVHDHVSSGSWKTVEEISVATGYPQPSVSAQLRNLRKEKFGGLDVRGRYRSGARIFEYKLVK